MALNKFSLKDKTALITGAAGLLGEEHATALLEVDANVILTDIDLTKLESLKKKLNKSWDSKKISVYKMDITNQKEVENIAKEIVKEGRFVDILINNAAVNPNYESLKESKYKSRLEDFSLERWEKELKVGLTGVFICSKIFGSLLAERNNGGIILNIASDLSVISPDQRIYQDVEKGEKDQIVKPISYSVIKTGIVGMTRYLSTYWIGKNIRANALSPGGVYEGQDAEFVQRISSLIPLGRMATKEEYRSAIQFLCSDASAYLNGQNIVMDGGRSIW